MMRLRTISFSALPRFPGMRPGDLITIDCERPTDALKDWRLELRGLNAWLVSPPGWKRDRGLPSDTKGPTVVYGPIPLADISLAWEVADATDLEGLVKTTKWTSPPFGWAPAPIATDKPLLAQVPASQMGD